MRPIVACSLVLLSGASARVSGHYLFAWTGDADRKGKDFLAVIDADPRSATYGRLVTTVVTDQQTMYVHHTEYTMPASGMLFANDHEAGRTFIFDVRDPLHPRVATSFTDAAGYMHPHSFVRLPNGHVLATFQHVHGDMRTGGLVELDDQGTVIRSASSADPAFPTALLTPYGLVVLPDLDRVVSTNSSMHNEDIFRGLTYQVWRLSDLKLLETRYLDQGTDHYAEISPEEPRLGPDGAVYIQTLACGLERITDIGTSSPHSTMVASFPASYCGVPTIVGHFLVLPDFYLHAVIVLDIAHGAKPVEVSRVSFDDNYYPHWTAWDPVTHRLVVTPGRSGDPRLYLMTLDETSGKLSIDNTFRDTDGNPGFNFANRDWPHGWSGTGRPHGAIFSR